MRLIHQLIVSFHRASMRPPEFTGGKPPAAAPSWGAETTASMRPPEFTGGKSYHRQRRALDTYRFNEAAGIHRRKAVANSVAKYFGLMELQ